MIPRTLFLLSVLQAPPDTGRTVSGLWYSVTGSGPSVLLLHGSNLDARSWGTLPAALAKDFRVIQADLRSHGRSRDAGGPFSWEADVVEVLDATKTGRATLIGHSLGAKIAIDVALGFPDRVSGLVLIGPAIGGMPAARPPAGIATMVAALQRGDLPAAGEALAAMPVMRLFQDSTRQSEVHTIVTQNVRLFRASPAWIRPLDPPAFGRLGSLTLPTFVLLGSADPTESNEAGRVLLEQVPGARGETVSGCGHLLPLDCPEPSIRAIRAFLTRLHR